MSLQPQLLGNVSENYFAHLREQAKDPLMQTLPLPLETLQRALGGLRAEEVTVLGGFEGHGKSALAQQIAFSAARDFGEIEEDNRLVLYHSLEMGQFQLLARYLVQQTAIPLNDLLNPENLSDREWRALSAWGDILARYRLMVFDSARQSTADLFKVAGDLEAAGMGVPKLIVIDYFHLLSDCLGGDVGKLDAGITALKDLARMAKAHVLALVRLNRAIEAGKLPTSHNIAGSQGIAYGADNVVLIHKPKLLDHDLGEEWEHFAYLKVEKQRNGPVGIHHLMWDPEHLCYRDLTKFEAKQSWSLSSGRTNRYFG